ncbi:MAG TPA: sulfite exporter TauE/SafE family protein [Polyangia bacterium]|jgi:hypothetical protein
MSPGRIALVAAVVFATSVVGTITGGNSLVNVPVMILCGLEPRAAVATNMFAVTFMAFGATVRFQRAKLVMSKLALPLCAIALVTSAIGARLTVALDEKSVKGIVAGSMVAMLLFMLARPRFGEAAVSPSGKRRAIGFVAAALLGVYGGLFSGGYTTLLTFTCVAAFGLPLLSSVGLTKLVNLVSSGAATLVFLYSGVVDLRVGVPLAASMLVGGWVGAHLAIRKGERFVRVIFLLMIAALAVKLLVFDLILGR